MEQQHPALRIRQIQRVMPPTTNVFAGVARVLLGRPVPRECVCVALEQHAVKQQQMVAMGPCVHVEVIRNVLIHCSQHVMA